MPEDRTGEKAREPTRLATALRIAATYAVAAFSGVAADAVGMPLPFVLGPLMVVGALAAAGAPVTVAPHMRELGQVVIGLAAGLRFTGPVLAAAVGLLPAMFVSSLYIVALTCLGALLLRPLAGIDRTTAFFATAAGGMADMAVVAHERGGDAGAVSIVHALRVASVVCVVPFMVLHLGTPGAPPSGDPASAGGVEAGLGLLVVVGLAYLAARLLKPTPIPNPWLFGPLIVGATLGASGLFLQPVPGFLSILAQLAVGTWLACRFRRELLARLPRVALSGLVVSLTMIVGAGVGAQVLSLATGLPLTTSFLSLAPAAITEMVLTAKAMNADVALVTAFHVMRIAVVSSTVLLVFNLYSRFGGRDGSSA
ncbi:AbrB family transcriptional regulator [Antarcticirhabdus aurantiaca]|uniref:AbrB family transcriptional regulator n=1 Tax=Antarcticirhabdus aurantiaca TaxID=2606717 RepID=A0ACD4NYZ8_9HYPH|nr:AbrB family transcriptional regulator [Antarcticirhabdus aurantiaca]WAJ31429.1 AbrB family transcriptional regulator [Jeongeuplla avenae]